MRCRDTNCYEQPHILICLARVNSMNIDSMAKVVRFMLFPFIFFSPFFRMFVRSLFLIRNNYIIYKSCAPSWEWWRGKSSHYLIRFILLSLSCARLSVCVYAFWFGCCCFVSIRQTCAHTAHATVNSMSVSAEFIYLIFFDMLSAVGVRVCVCVGCVHEWLIFRFCCHIHPNERKL